METYIMLTKLTDEGRKTLKQKPNRTKEVNKEVEGMGGKIVAQYAVLGPYDYVNVVEAPDNKTIARISMELGSRGTMTGIPEWSYGRRRGLLRDGVLFRGRGCEEPGREVSAVWRWRGPYRAGGALTHGAWGPLAARCARRRRPGYCRCRWSHMVA